MTAPVIASQSSNLVGTTNGDITVDFATDGPSGIEAGDFLLAIVAAVAATGGGNPAHGAAPDGWDKPEQSPSVIQRGIAAYTRVADGEETPPTFTATPNNSTYGMAAVVLRIPATSGLHKSFSSADNTGTPYSLLGVETEVADCLLIYAVVSMAASVRTHLWDPGAELLDFATDPGTACSLTIATLIQSSPGETGTQTVTANAAANMAGITIALAPSATPVQIAAPSATASALATVPTITAAIAAEVAAPSATSTAQAEAPGVTTLRRAEIAATAATAAAQAQAPVVTAARAVHVAAPSAEATAQAVAPVVSTQRQARVAAASAFGTAQMPAPSVTTLRATSIAALAAAASAQAMAPDIVTVAGASIVAPPAGAVASAPAPSVTANRTAVVQALAALATATAVVPRIGPLPEGSTASLLRPSATGSVGEDSRTTSSIRPSRTESST